MTSRAALAGAGTLSERHLAGLKALEGVAVTRFVRRLLEPTQAVARRYGIGHVGTDLIVSLAGGNVDAGILCTPAQMHAAQALQHLAAGKYVSG